MAVFQEGWWKKSADRTAAAPSFFTKGNPLARLKKSLDSSYHHRAGILVARSIIGGEGTSGRQSKRFVTAAEERVRCSIGRRRTGLTATMFDLSAAFSR